MGGNCFGTLFKIMTWGESHGPALGVVIDGCPPGINLSPSIIQKQVDRRRPGQSKSTTSRNEADKVEILSGVYDGRTTGTPISLLIKNSDQKSGHYENIKNLYRPGHADITYDAKYGFRDYRGGGRSSGRETAGRVAAGAVAMELLKKAGVKICASTIQIGNVKAKKFIETEIESNEVRCADPDQADKMIALIMEAREKGDSVGGVVEVFAENVTAGLGEPVFDKLDADIAKALMSIGSVKGVEIGNGFKSAALMGSQNNDEIITRNGKTTFKTNNAGGILGGISNGDRIYARIAVKPTPSISLPQKTVNQKGEDEIIQIKGRHDPCICPRIIPVAESMMALVLADHLMRQKALLCFQDLVK